MTAGLLSGCGPMSAFSWATKDAPKDFVAGTRVLAEVIRIVPRQSVVYEEYLFGGWRDTLISVGYSDSDIVDGSEIIAWAYCYGHNSGVTSVRITGITWRMCRNSCEQICTPIRM